jgi:hypothetical protein
LYVFKGLPNCYSVFPHVFVGVGKEENAKAKYAIGARARLVVGERGDNDIWFAEGAYMEPIHVPIE